MSVKALKEQDVELADDVLKKDDEIDQLDLEIEQECMMLLALQQPLAKDLRTIATILKIITDLERMGDNAVNIAKIVSKIGKEPLIKPLVDIPKMADICQQMVRQSLDAFVNEDIKIAEEVGKRDEEVDELYEKVVREVLVLISKKNDFIDQGTNLMFVGRYLERIADHSTNICERIIYMVTGELKEIN
jgi:phosphate transport system protein